MAQNKLYVGNLPFSATEDDVREAFEAFGTVVGVTLVMDRETGRPRGFGFVEYASPEEAQAAIQGLDGQDFGGRSLRVNEAKPREPRRGGGGYGGGGGGGGGYGGGGGRRGGW